MGLFSFFSSFNNGVVKNNAAIIIDKLLNLQYQSGVVPVVPNVGAGKAMVEYVWNDAPSVFSGKNGERPSSEIVALAALGNFIYRNVGIDDKSFFGLISAYNYLDMPYLNDYRIIMRFNETERMIYDMTSKMVVKIMDEYEEKHGDVMNEVGDLLNRVDS